MAGAVTESTVEQTRKLAEEEVVLFTFNALGTPTNAAVQRYLNAKGVPQLFVSSGASRWGDPEHVGAIHERHDVSDLSGRADLQSTDHPPRQFCPRS
jgi:pyridoxal biosynthesis lyase PdxS